jgi:hypothetical protein
LERFRKRSRSMALSCAPSRRRTAERGGVRENRAFSLLRERAAEPKPRAATPLVRLLVAVGDIDQAWEEARKFGLDRFDLVDLARRRAERHPADAIPILLREAELAIRRSDSFGYARKAAELLAELKELHWRAGLDFADCLERFKAAGLR